MNKELLESQWVQMREVLRDKFANLSDEDIRQINGRYDQLVTKLQQRYGFTREESEEEIRKWVVDRGGKPLNQDKPFARTMRDAETYREPEEGSSFFKWLLLAGIPLLFILGYLGYQNSQPPANVITAPVNNQAAMTTSAASDQLISDTITRSLGANALIAPDLSNIQVSTSGGVVTFRGNVGSAQEKDAISNIARSISGVTRVDNQLIVR